MKTANPLLRAWRLSGGSDLDDGWFGGMTRVIRAGESLRIRDIAVSRWSWAIPTNEAILTIVKHSPGGVVEIGAGAGYWARLITRAGGDVVAFDKHPPPHPDNVWHEKTRPWFDVQAGGPEAAARYPDRTLLLCWPPYSWDVAARAARAHLDAGGRRLIYIGEGASGCTGDETFHAMLEEGWCPGCSELEDLADAEHVAWCGVKPLYDQIDSVAIPQWWGMHDRLTVWQAKP